MKANIYYSDFRDFKGLLQTLQLLIASRDVEILAMGKTHYVVDTSERVLNLLYKY